MIPWYQVSELLLASKKPAIPGVIPFIIHRRIAASPQPLTPCSLHCQWSAVDPDQSINIAMIYGPST